jgi:chromosome segregation ATPase
MTDEELRELLAEIRDELEHTDTDDKREQEILRDLITDIQTLLDEPEKEPVQPEESMLGRLEDAIEKLETTNPTLTRALADLLTALGNVGI